VSGVRKEATGGRRQQIPFEDWYDVKIGEGTRGEFFAEPEWRSKTLVWWHDLAFRSEDILREFPTPTAGDDQSSEQETQTAAQVVTPPLDQMPAGTNTTSAVAKPRPPSPAAAERGYLKYVEDFKTAHRSRDEDIAYMQAEFPGITASAVRQLRQQFAPAEWSRRGRRRNGDG
jgi:hypothetical protein